MKPKVSILLPNLNNYPYLEERMASIIDQSWEDWELVIVDNYSDDGAWEFFQQWQLKEPRIRLFQAPRKGMYTNWNNCIRQAQGEYIYIATSDDTMTPDFLEIMVQALDNHPDCDLAHCKLKIIDKNGAPHPTLCWDKFYCSTYFGKLIDREHIRRAPHDGLLHCGVKTVYTSITQLLIRKKLFDDIGLFLTGCGSIADYEWEMRASLVANTYHIPRYLATWRVHNDQGTSLAFLKTAAYRHSLLNLLKHAVQKARQINPRLLNGIKIKNMQYLYRKECFRLEFIEKQVKSNTRFIVALKWLLMNPAMLMEGFRFYLDIQWGEKRPFLSPQAPLEFSKKLITQYGAGENIEILKEK